MSLIKYLLVLKYNFSSTMDELIASTPAIQTRFIPSLDIFHGFLCFFSFLVGTAGNLVAMVYFIRLVRIAVSVDPLNPSLVSALDLESTFLI